ncbi:nucleotidyl transferase AbiEii/AbiGii toxin family protein [Candidatus Dojkabacteria bacterium]|nr:nucleotidyl transferase AbiEii/AbiGii toxin family protein [Candidatus Dojkabacteria bacterium]
MLSIQEIATYYNEKEAAFKDNILREYLQYLILQKIFQSKYANRLSFLGDTSLRIIYNNQRFSEDLDFDFFQLTFSDFQDLATIVAKELELEGYKIEIRNKKKGAFHCYIRIPEILYAEGLSPLREQKILIQLDATSHGFDYTPDRKIIDKFGIFTEVFTTPLDILLSQKIFAIFNRKRPKGRDFFDTTFLMSKTKPNYAYLAKKLDIHNERELKKELTGKIHTFDLEILAEDVEKFLINSSDKARITKFKDIIKQTEL